MTLETIIKFTQVTFDYGHDKTILDNVSFSVRKGMKVALMGQNGAGKSTLFRLMTRKINPTSGDIAIDKRLTVATSYQTIDRGDMLLSVEQYFEKAIGPDIEPHILKSKLAQVLDVVNLKAPLDKVIKTFSGGQQARLLLAQALIKSPDLLLLDEPTNNLDHAGIAHLTDFLINYNKSVVVISHDAEFLNAFTQGVLYLDGFTKKVEQYAGDYNDVIEQIAVRIERERRQNAQMEKGIIENKEKSNFFANKGGKMRLVAKKMRTKAEKMESEKVAVRKEDRTIRPFIIPPQADLVNEDVRISSFTVIQDHNEITKQSRIFLTKGKHLLVRGKNGIGKSTLIESIINGTAQGVTISEGVRIGYYRQDFATLNMNDSVYESFCNAVRESGGKIYEQEIRSVSSGFLISSDHIHAKIGTLSEGQKGLVSFARLVLMKPGLLILDEPTNHINFRHIPRIAEALSEYKGIMILVSHVAEFVAQVKIDDVLDLEA